MENLQSESELAIVHIDRRTSDSEHQERIGRQQLQEAEPTNLQLRRDVVQMLARERELDRKLRSAEKRAFELEELAIEAIVDRHDKPRGRELLGLRLDQLKIRESLSDELRSTRRRTRRLKARLLRRKLPVGR